MRWILFAFAAALQAETVAGLWDATVHVNETDVPFRIAFDGEGKALRGWFFNGDEKVLSTSGLQEGNRVSLRFAHYGADLRAEIADGELRGAYTRGTQAVYPFRAQRHAERLTVAANAPDIAGLWEIAVETAKGEAAWKLLVTQQGDEVQASILRVDGDTGQLAGLFRDGRFVLSHFSGARPSLLTLQAQPDGSLAVQLAGKGRYTALRPEEARAKGLAGPADPARHTTVKNLEEPLRFRLPDLQGREVSEADFAGKVVLVNITGSWCPNCHDEAPFLAELYQRYKSQGLEVAALSFEEAEQLANPERLRAFIKQYGITYPVLLGGEPSELATKLPQAVHLNSWPTTFFLDRTGRVRHVHAGFAGRATGPLHEAAKEEFIAAVERLLANAESN